MSDGGGVRFRRALTCPQVSVEAVERSSSTGCYGADDRSPYGEWALLTDLGLFGRC